MIRDRRAALRIVAEAVCRMRMALSHASVEIGIADAYGSVDDPEGERLPICPPAIVPLRDWLDETFMIVFDRSDLLPGLQGLVDEIRDEESAMLWRRV